jgi:NTP pyrophosphatase (non-canonical NTP hydrolase)
MNFNDFQPLALKTESKPETIKAAPATLLTLLGVAVSAANMLDLAKKAIFYGKPFKAEEFGAHVLGSANALYFLADIANKATSEEAMGDFLTDRQFEDALLADMKGKEGHNQQGIAFLQTLDPSKLNVRLLHAAIGKVTESGEFLDAIMKAWIQGVEPDRVNLGEEIADGSWYDAIACDELKLDMGTLLDTVIAKLKARYGDKFDSDKSEQRNLDAERAVLEAGIEAKAEVL